MLYIKATLLLLLLWQPAAQLKRPDFVKAITKVEWQQGAVPDKLHPDASVVKKEGVLYLSRSCAPLRDTQERECRIHEYVGDLAYSPKLKVARRELCNGEEYVVADTRNGCKQYTFTGRPYGRKSLLVNYDETRTTDRLCRFEFWRITPMGISRLKVLDLQTVYPSPAIRFSLDGKRLLFQDEQAHYWSVVIPGE